MRLSPTMSPADAATYTAIPNTRTRAFSARNYCESSHRFLWHYHPEWELTWISSGRGQRYIGCAVDPFEPGDLVLLGGNLPHTWHSDPNDPDEARCSVIQFLPSRWGAEFWELPEIRKFRGLCDSAVRGLRFTGPGVDEVGRRIQELAALYVPDFRSFARFIEILDLLTQLPVKSLNASREDSNPAPNPRLQSLLEWIEAHCSEPLTQAEVAARVSMSSATFCRWFKTEMGCVFVRYLNELRIARACSMLVEKETSVTECAFGAGFNNLSNFNRRFQDITGITPTAFRRQFREREKRGK